QLFATLTLKMEPFENAPQPVVVLRQVPANMVPEPMLQAGLEELKLCGQGGGILGGYPLMKVKATALAAEWHETQSTDVAFRIAASDAFEKGLRAAGPVLLEPVMKLEIYTPDDYVGDIIGDLLQR